jgi:aminoglycoside 6'-N-acetyltransferase I
MVPDIRPFAAQDLDPCTDLFIRVFSEPPWHDKWPSIEVARAYLRHYVDTPGFEGLVATVDQQIVAFLFGHHRLWWSGSEYYIDEFGVHPDMQGQGIGTMLLDRLKQTLLQNGVHTITLLTANDTPAAAFYAKQGFVTHKRMAFMSHRITDQEET